MKIGLVTQAYYPVLGGVTEHVWHLSGELEKRGHQVTIITGTARQPDDRGRRVIRIGVQIPVAANGANNHITLGWKLGRTLQRIEEQENFDIVHVQAAFEPGLPLIACKTMRRPKVGTFHSYWEPDNPVDLIPRIFRPVFLDAVKKVQAFIAVSQSAEAAMRRHIPDLQMEIILNGIDLDRFNPSVQPFEKYRDGKYTVLYVGRMDPRKGAKFLFAALPYLEDGLQGNYRVLVVGTGWMKKYYDALIPLKLRSRVEFAGYASPEDLPRYYRSADVYCSPATGGESFGIVLIEAMASGIPLVASDIEGYRWVIDPGREGLLVPPRSPRHLANALIELAHHPEQCKTMGQSGRVKAAQYSWPSVVDRIEAVYRRVLDPGRASMGQNKS